MPRHRAGWLLLVSKGLTFTRRRADQSSLRYLRKTEEGEENTIGQLQLSLYGRRDSAQNRADEYTSHLVHLGFEVGRASPCNFVREKRGLALTVHGDDGDETQLQWLGDKMQNKYELKIGPETHQEKEVRVSNRIIRWTRHGLEFEVGPRHAEKIVCDRGMEKARGLSTPCVQEGATNHNADDGWKGLLQPLDATKLRSIAARRYLAADRLELKFASKCASKYMANPTCEGLTLVQNRQVPQGTIKDGSNV